MKLAAFALATSTSADVLASLVAVAVSDGAGALDSIGCVGAVSETSTSEVGPVFLWLVIQIFSFGYANLDPTGLF